MVLFNDDTRDGTSGEEGKEFLTLGRRVDPYIRGGGGGRFLNVHESVWDSALAQDRMVWEAGIRRPIPATSGIWARIELNVCTKARLHLNSAEKTAIIAIYQNRTCSQIRNRMHHYQCATKQLRSNNKNKMIILTTEGVLEIRGLLTSDWWCYLHSVVRQLASKLLKSAESTFFLNYCLYVT